MICSRSSNSCYFIQNCIANVEVPKFSTFVGGGGGGGGDAPRPALLGPTYGLV